MTTRMNASPAIDFGRRPDFIIQTDRDRAGSSGRNTIRPPAYDNPRINALADAQQREMAAGKRQALVYELWLSGKTRIAWRWCAAPSVCIILLVTSLVCVSRVYAEVANPRLRKR